MKKELLERFIAKYSLNGIISSAVWTVNDGTLQVASMDMDNKLFVGVMCPHFYECDDAEIGVWETNKLCRMLRAIPSEDISLELVKYSSGEVAVLTFANATMRVEYVTANPKYIGIPKMKNIPPWNAGIILDNEFKNWFLKVKMGKFSLFTIAMSERTGKLELKIIDDKTACVISFHPQTTADLILVKAPISFSAHCLRRILRANSEFKNPILKISDAGLAFIDFPSNDLVAEYYVVKIDAED